MRWIEKFLDQLETAIEWQSPGTMSWRFHEDENWLRLTPSLVELAGGADDGEAVYPFFSLYLSNLMGIFDELPEMSWDGMNNEFSIEGKIVGDDAWITISREPFEDEELGEVFDSQGGFRKKKPPTE